MSEQINNQPVLKHHGIPNQTWGLRRFQNPDGSLTPAGRERYGVGPARQSKTDQVKSATTKDKERAKLQRAKAKQRLEKEKARLELEKLKKERHDLKRSRKASEKQRNKEQVEDLKEVSKEKILASDNPKLLLKYKTLFTTKELKDAYDRIQIEKNLADFIPHERSLKEKIHAFLKDTNAGLKEASGIVTTTLSLLRALNILQDNKENNNEKGLKLANESIKELNKNIKQVSDDTGKQDQELNKRLDTLQSAIDKVMTNREEFEKAISSDNPKVVEKYLYSDVLNSDALMEELKHSIGSIPLSVLNRNII